MADALNRSEHWYEMASPPFRQGDIFQELTVGWLPSNFSEQEEIEVELASGTWIVLEASCELDQGRCSHVLMARVFDANASHLKASKEKELNQRLEVLRRGDYPTKFLLSDFDKASFPLSFVEFSQRTFVPLPHLTNFTEQKEVIRMKSPFREKFGNWIGACFSRVGPEDHTLILPFVKGLHDEQRLKASDE